MPLIGFTDEDRHSFSLSVHEAWVLILEKDPYFGFEK